jgi:putative flippase GtrA
MKEVWRAVKFVLFSLSAGIIDFGSFFIMNNLLGWNTTLSQVISVVLSVLWNFTLNRKFTFKSAANVPIAMLKLGIYYLAFIPLSALLTNWLVGMGWNADLVKILTMALNMSTEYLVQRFFMFGKSLDTNQKEKK